jgi:nucleoside-diphosphate-sugar epimerase
MECIVTGAAGFIGSHVCERLLAEGHRVVGLDCFTSYYPREIKQNNLSTLLAHKDFSFHSIDLSRDELNKYLIGAEWVFHLAAMPGLVKSWTDFASYDRNNILATQRLLEALRPVRTLNRFIFASTSSVYGKYASGDESLPIRPTSPYGITKFTAEELVRVYGNQFEIPGVILRYFSVFGPRQRPEMGYHQFIDAILRNQPIHLTGNGSQIRGNTYISDCVAATIQAANAIPGEVFNVGGGESLSIREVIHLMEKLTGRRAIIKQEPERAGDQQHTGADITKIRHHLNWSPRVSIQEGLERQIHWQQSQMPVRLSAAA